MAGHKRPGVGTQTLVPLNISAVVAPLHWSTAGGLFNWLFSTRYLGIVWHAVH